MGKDLLEELTNKIINLPGDTTIDNKAVEVMLGLGALAVAGATAYGITEIVRNKKIKAQIGQMSVDIEEDPKSQG